MGQGEREWSLETRVMFCPVTGPPEVNQICFSYLFERKSQLFYLLFTPQMVSIARAGARPKPGADLSPGLPRGWKVPGTCHLLPLGLPTSRKLELGWGQDSSQLL